MSDLRETLRALDVLDGEPPPFGIAEPPTDPHELSTERLPAERCLL